MEKMGSGKKKAIPKDSGLIELMFSWSLDDIFNGALYSNQVERIPETFGTMDDYFKSYTYPLLEEIREQMCSSMEDIHSAPFAEVTSFEESKPYGSLLYDINVDAWRNRYSDRSKEPYKTLPGDVFILTDAKPETVSDLQRVGRTWTFASVTKITDDENEDISTSTYFKVKISEEYGVGDGKQGSMFVIFLINVVTNKRIWNALHMYEDMSIIREVLSPVSGDKEYCYQCSDGVYGEDFSLSSLNESQVEAVLNCLEKIQCSHKPSVELIWGPPGTGKTKTVSMLLFNILKINIRTITCAPTNVAVTEVASRVLKLMKESFENSLFCSLGDILIFGNEDRLKVGPEIVEIYLNYRADRLIECFGPLTGWRHCFNSMIDFLEDCVSHHQIFLENELRKENSCSSEGGSNGEQAFMENNAKKVDKSFIEFARNRFRANAGPLRRCVQIFCTHLSKDFILEQNFKSMVNLILLLDSFESLLSKDGLVPEELEKLFSHQEEVQDSSPSFSDSSDLLYFCRRECLSVLKTLRSSLNELRLPSAMNADVIKDFCLKMASLIFCTASSSYKLYRVNMKPLDLLVIDEAAQLKECESAIPLQLPDIKHALLIGDECQLPAMVSSKVSEEAGFGRSLFERLSSLSHFKHLLNVQYRMHPSISFFPNSKFYLNQIMDGPNVISKDYNKHYLPGPMFGSYSFINIRGKEEHDDVGKSRRNMIEVAIVIKIVRNLYKEWSGSNQKLSIGVISPYAAQVVAIEDKLGQKYEKLGNFSVKVKTVDGFQGGEEDIIIVCTVRSNAGGSIGFLSNPKRSNVSLTRARHCLWILGNERTLVNSESIWRDLVHDAKRRQCFFNADEDKDIAKAILEVKTEFDQLDHLLDGTSILFKSAMWKVLFSDNFKKSFVKLRSDQTKKSVMNLLLKLSSGWRPKRLNVDRVCGSSSQILKQFKVEGLYVVCSIDIIKNTQVLRVWDILPLEGVPKLAKRLENIFQRYTDDFINCCKEKCLNGNLEVPKSWPASSNIIQYKNNDEAEDNEGSSDHKSYVENSKVSESLLLMKFYSLSSGMVSHLLSDHDGRELDLPFEVTDQEQDIILYSRSSFILGRSGTGKTTVLTMKLFQKEQHHHMAIEGFQGDKDNASTSATYGKEVGTGVGETRMAVLRQLFVTVSPKLCYAVKQHVSHLKSFAHGKNFSAEGSNNEYVDDAELFDDIQDTLVDIPPKLYPLVLTFHKFLMMLDGTLGNSYFDRFHDVRELCHGKSRSLSSIGLQTLIRTKEVTYDRFSSSYWPHFNTQLTKKLDSSRAFTEIISYIKGGLKGGRVPDGKLSRDDYVMLSEGRVSTLSAQKRERIYDIFLDYEKMKMGRGEFDLADLVIDLHHRLRQQRYMGDEMDFVYIDEVQDLTMRQIALFKYICKNVDEGFVFSGDTAQTIARGIDFRFQDIRSLFYNEFVMESSDECDGTKEKGQISEIFHLSQNFRTHAGVLKLSQSIIDLLYRYFPQSIDVLSPETSEVYGEAPVLLEPGKDENAIITMFGNHQNIGGSMVGFGAEQVILVRDDCSRKEISDIVGEQALVLTILECKGLEFQDVLLYNFFGSSPLKNQWRVLYGYMKEQGLLDSTAPGNPSFSHEKHNVMCSELKQLYVAITRTRQRLWICENIEEFSKPMFDYWKKMCLVQVTQLDESLAHEMRVASTPEEWKATGIKLLREHHYEMATRCFERAGDSYWARLAKAHGLKAAAEKKRDLNPEASLVDLRKAAEIFEEIGEARSAAKCFFQLKEYQRAGEIYLENFGASELEKAGECFSLAGLYERAAEVYATGHFISECLSACTKGKFFDMGLHYIQYWKQLATTSTNMIKRSKEIEKIEQEFLESSAHHYHELKDTRTMMIFVKAFHSVESQRNFLTTLDCLNELLQLEEELGNFLEAAKLAKQSGEILLEAEMLGKAGGNYRDASTLFLCYVFANSLWASGSKGWPLKQFEKKKELLTKSRLFAESESKQFHEFISTEVIILSNEQTSLFEMNQCLTASQRHKSVRGEIVSARKIIDAHLGSNTTKYEWTDEWVSDLKQCSEVRLSQNCISVETLLCFWNVWKENIVNIFEFLELDETTQDVKDYSNYEEFCFNYFGVRRQYKNGNLIHSLLIPDAYWLREVDRFIQRTGRLLYIDANKFTSAARRYWSSELLSVGIQVLENLEVLYNYSTWKPLSLFCQTKLLIHMFEIAEFLSELKYLDRRYNVVRTLQKFLDISTQQFCSKVFPLDLKKSSTESMVSLRETELSRNLLKRVISSRISMKNELSYGEIGRVASWILGTGKLTAELYEKIAERFAGNPPWQAFIDNLVGRIGSGFPQGSVPINESQKHVSLVLRLNGALRDTYYVYRGQKDYISPDYFIYLVDRLLILVTSFQGYCFTTKSSFVEWLIFHEWKSNPNPGLVENKQFAFGATLDFIAHTAQDLLNKHQVTVQWIRNSNINMKEYYPLFVLRLVIMICLICVNVKQVKYFDMLFRLLRRGDITSQLPRGFCDVLQRRRGKQNRFSINENVLAEALRKVDDPLVIVKFQRNSSQVSCADAIFVDMTVNRSKEDLLQVLFERNINSSSVELPLNLVSGVNQGLKSQNDEVIEGNPQNNYEHFWDFLDALDDNCSATSNFLPNAPRVKVEVETNIRLITSVLATFHKNPAEGEDVNLCQELNSMLDELRQLSSALNASNNGSTIGELFTRLKSRKPKVEPLLKQLFLEKDSSTAESGVSSSATIIPSAIQNQADKEDGTGTPEESEEADEVQANNGETESQKGKKNGKGSEEEADEVQANNGETESQKGKKNGKGSEEEADEVDAKTPSNSNHRGKTESQKGKGKGKGKGNGKAKKGKGKKK